MVFYVRNRTMILVISPLISVYSFTRISAGLRSGEPWLNWLAGLVLWLFLLLVAIQRRLVLTPDGLEYREYFTTAHVPWKQVTRLVSRRALGIFAVEGLEVWTGSPRPRDLFIELTQFSRAWRQSTLGAILRGRAPQLFQESAPSGNAA